MHEKFRQIALVLTSSFLLASGWMPARADVLDVSYLLSNNQATATSSALDSSFTSSVFDGDTNTFARPLADNPMQVTLTFSEQQSVTGSKIWFGGGDTAWRLETANSLKDLDSGTNSFYLALDWYTNSSGGWRERTFSTAPIWCRAIRLKLQRLGGDDRAQLNEWQLVAPPGMPTNSFRIVKTITTTNQELIFEYESNPLCYYILYEGDLGNITTPRSMQLGLPGNQVMGIPRNTNSAAFYRLRRVLRTDPLDTDADGIDDTWELMHESLLNPLNPADADSFAPNDSKTLRERYYEAFGYTNNVRTVTNDFRITGLSISNGQTLMISYPSQTNFYYALYAGTNADRLYPQRLNLGKDGGDLFSVSVLSNKIGLFRVRRLPIAAPVDLDADGMDDVYELRNSAYLNPLYASDAFQHQGGNPKSNLEVYQTTPLNPSTNWFSDWKNLFAVSSLDLAIAIQLDGTLWTWGAQPVGDGTTDSKTFPVQISSDTNWVSVAADYNRVYALKRDGTLWHWGSLGGLVPAQVDSSTNWILLSAGVVASKADGSWWAFESSLVSPNPLGSGWKTVSASTKRPTFGKYYSGIRLDGSLWEVKSSGAGPALRQLGTDTNWVGVDGTMDSHTLAWNSDNHLFIWGNNNKGQLGLGFTNALYYDFTNAIDMGTGWSNVCTSSYGSSPSATVAIKDDGTLWQWGGHRFFNGPAILSPTQVGSESNWVAAKISGSEPFYLMAVKQDGSLWAIGSGRSPDSGQPELNHFYGQYTRSTNVTEELFAIGSDTNWQSAFTDGGQTFATKTDGSLWYWGLDPWKQTNYFDHAITNVYLPTRLGTNSDWRGAWTRGAGSYGGGTIALKTNGTVWAWNRFLELVGEFNGIAYKNAPMQLPTNAWLPSLAAKHASGANHTLDINSNGTIYAWGSNNVGQLGNGNFNYRSDTSPATVGPGWQGWKWVVATNNYSMGMMSNGTVYAWGSLPELLGVTGVTDFAHVTNPVSIYGRFLAVVTNNLTLTDSTASVMTNGSLWVKNGGISGALGDGSKTGASQPVPINAYPPSKPFYIGTPPPQPVLPGIQHVVVVMMENRSFDHFLGWVPGADGPPLTKYYPDTTGQNPVQPWHITTPQGCNFANPGYDYSQARDAFNRGACDGWLKVNRDENYCLSFYEQLDLPFFSEIATHWTVCDHYFSAVMASTQPNRLFLHCGQTDSLKTRLPTPRNRDYCYLETIWSLLSEWDVKAGYFTDSLEFSDFLTFDSLSLFPPYTYHDIRHGIADFEERCRTGANLPAVSYVDPILGIGESKELQIIEHLGENDDHPPQTDIRDGEEFLARIYNAVVSSPYWSSTVLVITFDEWGGMFDHVPPTTFPGISESTRDAYAAANILPNDPIYGLRGFRVPCVVISPWTQGGKVAKADFDHNSILKMIEWRWGLPALSVHDQNAPNLAQVLDFAHPDYTRPPIIRNSLSPKATVVHPLGGPFYKPCPK